MANSPFGDFVSAGSGLVGGLLGFAQQAAQNDINIQQAEINRNWQEKMSNTAYQRSVADMLKAGLNPALMYGNGSAASTPSGSTASSAGFNAVADALAVQRQQAEIKNIESQTNKNNTEAGLFQKQIDWFEPLTEAQLGEINQRIATGAADEALKRAGVSREEAQALLASNQAALARIDAETRSQLNTLQIELDNAFLSRNSAEIKRLEAETNNLYQDAILKACQAGYYSQAEINLMEEQGLIQLDKQSHQFYVDNQVADRQWRIIGQLSQSLYDVTGSVGNVVGAVSGSRQASAAVQNAATNASRGFSRQARYEMYP